VASQAIPLIAIAPIVHLWLPGIEGIIGMAALIAFFPITIAFRIGLASAPEGETQIFRMHGGGWAVRMRKLQLPRSLSHVFAGLRVAAPLSVIGSIVAEFTGTDRGLGRNLLRAAKTLEPELMVASLILSTLLGIAFYGGILLLERIVVPRSYRHQITEI
jgi:NitT/TauT family transport system permease protein